MPIWLMNPRKKRKVRRSKSRKRSASARRRRSPPKGFRTWRAYMASIRPKGRKGGKSMARKRKSVRRRGSVRRKVRRFRRNPPMGLGRLFSVNTIMSGVKHGGLVLAGKGATRAVVGFIPLPIPKTGVVGALLQGIVATALGGFAARFVGGAQNAQFFIAGGWAGAMEEIAKGLPVIGPMLSAYPEMGSFPGDDQVLGELPAEILSSPAALFGDDGVDDNELLVGGY